MYLGWLKHGGTGTILHVNYRHRSKFMHSNVPHKVHEYTAVTRQSSTCFHLKYSYWVCFLCSVPRSLEAWRNMEHLPQKLHLSIHNYADSGVIHNLSLSHFRHNAHQSNLRKNTVLKRLLPRNKILYLELYLLKPTWFGYFQTEPKKI